MKSIDKINSYFNLSLTKEQINAATNLLNGVSVEMKPGEGKTLSIIAAVVESPKKQKIIVFPTEYLAERDFKYSYDFFKANNISSTYFKNDLNDFEKSDVIYMSYRLLGQLILYLQKQPVLLKKIIHNDIQVFIDEVDIISVDMSSEPIYELSELPLNVDEKILFELLSFVNESDVIIDEDTLKVSFSDDFINRVLNNLSLDLYEFENLELLENFSLFYKAQKIMKNGVDYVVQDDKVIPINQYTKSIENGTEFTGGLQQFLQIKENVSLTPMRVVSDHMSSKNIFSYFHSISGCSGTIGKMKDIVENVIHGKMISIKPHFKRIVEINRAKFFGSDLAVVKNVVKDIKKNEERSILIMTTTKEMAYLLAEEFDYVKNSIDGKLSFDDSVVSKSGLDFGITIVDISAGRGVNIELSDDVLKSGGIELYLIGAIKTEREFEQAVNRIGRRGAPGVVYQYLSLTDKFFQEFNKKGFEKVKNILNNLSEDGYVDGRFYRNLYKKSVSEYTLKLVDTISDTLKYDDILFAQKKVILNFKEKIISSNLNWILELYDASTTDLVNSEPEIINENLGKFFNSSIGFNIVDDDASKDEILKEIRPFFSAAEDLDGLKKTIVLMSNTILDSLWKKHYVDLMMLRDGIHMRTFMSSKDPFNEYMKISHSMFESLKLKIARNIFENSLGLIVSTLSQAKTKSSYDQEN